MGILQPIIDTFAALFGFRQGVSEHIRRQAFGPRWSRHRPRRIHGYRRRRPRQSRRSWTLGPGGER